jgi:hypothetical protein
MSMAVNMTIEQVAHNHSNFVSQQPLNDIGRDLEKVK